MLILIALVCFVLAVLSWTYCIVRFKAAIKYPDFLIPCLCAIVFMLIATDRVYTMGQESGAIEHHLNNIKVVRGEDYWYGGKTYASYNVYWVNNYREPPIVKGENK